MYGATTLYFPRSGTVSVMKLRERRRAAEDLFKVVSLGLAMTDLQLITESYTLLIRVRHSGHTP